MPTIEDIQNFRQIRPNLLTAGQPKDTEFDAIRAAGVELVINLATDHAQDFNRDEKAIVESLQLRYIHIPVAWDHPTRTDLDRFFEAMDRNKNQKIFVHCARNMRVSSFVFLYRVIRNGEDPNHCLKDLEAVWQPNSVWAAFIDTNLPPSKR